MFAHVSVALLAVAGLASAQYNTPVNNGTALPVPVSTVTKVVDVYTTYCPYATTFTFNGKAYTATEATTFTITDCPCTVVETGKPVPPPTAVPAPPAGSAPAGSAPAGSAPAGYAPPAGNTGSPAQPSTTDIIVSGAGEVSYHFGAVAAAGVIAAGMLAL